MIRDEVIFIWKVTWMLVPSSLGWRVSEMFAFKGTYVQNVLFSFLLYVPALEITIFLCRRIQKTNTFCEIFVSNENVSNTSKSLSALFTNHIIYSVDLVLVLFTQVKHSKTKSSLTDGLQNNKICNIITWRNYIYKLPHGQDLTV